MSYEDLLCTAVTMHKCCYILRRYVVGSKQYSNIVELYTNTSISHPPAFKRRSNKDDEKAVIQQCIDQQ